MTITGGSALPKDEIDRMVAEAEAHAAEDAKRRSEADARNGAEQAVYASEKALSENDDKLPDDVKTEVRAAIDNLKASLEADDSAETIKAKHTALMTASQKIGQAVYAQSEADDAATDGPAGSSGAADDDVVDAEIVDEDEDR